MNPTTDTPRTDACPHCGAEEINPQEKSIRYKCGSKEDGVFSYSCQVNRVVKLEAEVERLQEWVRSEWPADQAEEIIRNCKSK